MRCVLLNRLLYRNGAVPKLVRRKAELSKLINLKISNLKFNSRKFIVSR